jgi:hypothetical protein
MGFICHNAGEFPNKKGAAEAAPFLSCLLQDVLFGLWPKPAHP